MHNISATNTALEIISSAGLSPTEHILLKNFIKGAADSELAAKHLISRIVPDSQQGIEISLRDFKKDWRKLVTRVSTFDPISKHLASLIRLRDGPRCTATKDSRETSVVTTEPAYVIPPSIFDNLEAVEDGRLFMMLEAYLSPSYVTKLRNLLLQQEATDEDSLQNLWLLSPSAHRAFREGHIAVRLFQSFGELEDKCDLEERITDAGHILETMYPDEIPDVVLGDGSKLKSYIRFKLSTPNVKTLPTPSTFLFGVHRRFANALHLFYIEDKVARGWPQPPRDYLGFDIPVLRQAFYRLWLWVPLAIRLRCYILLKGIGKWLYGPTLALWVHRLPFGLILKQCVRSPQNEPTSLKLVEKYTSIPAPRVVDVGEYGGNTYLVMTRLRGQMLHEVLHLMSYAERDRLADDLGSYVTQLRKIPNHTAYMFCNALGGPIVDHRIPDMSGGPFNSESDFNNHLTSHLGCSSAEALGEENVPQGHRSYFTHSDFHRTNLLIDRGRLSGIIDWECAGYLPEYWEFTKAMYTTLQNPILESIFRRAFGHRYESELIVERKLWYYTPFGV